MLESWMTRPYQYLTDAQLQQTIDRKQLEIQAAKDDCAELVREQARRGQEK